MKSQEKNFIIYKSSAGSGKTFTLVKEYLQLVLDSPGKYNRVLGITFTNKAANEMKDRVLHYLKQVSDPVLHKDSIAVRYLLPDLIQETGLSETLISQRASEVLSLIMHNYSDFAIGTIDSFMQRIIRTFAQDLKIPLDFEVELDTTGLLSRVIDILISKVGNEEKLTSILVDFVENKAGEEENWNIEKDLLGFSSVLLKEESLPYLDRIRKLTIDQFSIIRQKVHSFLFEFENAIRKQAVSALNLIASNGISIYDFYYGKSGIGNYFRVLAEGNFNSLEPNSRVLKTVGEGTWYSAKLEPGAKQIIDRIAADLLQNYNSISEIIERDGTKYNTYFLLYKNLYPIAVLNEIEKELESYKSDNNVLLISEFNQMINRVVADQPSPFIYERLGEKYQHYLLDEFQDTSILQWHNLLPLIDNSLAGNNFNMIVGDGKQAIYRFRSGDVEQFEKLPYLIQKQGITLQTYEDTLLRNHVSKNLDMNFRSCFHIVDFNNSFFSFARDKIPENYRPVYLGLEQKIARKDDPGMVRIDVVEKSDGVENYRMEVMAKIMGYIKELEADNFDLRDVAILCRSNIQASQIASFLLQNQIPVISSESLLLSNSPRVNFIVCWMRLLAESADQVSMASVLNFLSKSKFSAGKSADEFLRNLMHEVNIKDPLYHIILQDNFERIVGEIKADFSFRKIRSLDFYQLTEYLIRIFDLNDPPDPYLQFFQDAVLAFTSDRKAQLSDLLEWWDDKGKAMSIVVPSGLDAISVMTIHKAKGLEFPAVIYPFAEDKIKLTRNNIWTDYDDVNIPELKAAYLPVGLRMEQSFFGELYLEEMDKSYLDMLNILYVVLTRPVERLYIQTVPPPKEIKEYLSVPALFDEFMRLPENYKEPGSGFIYGERSLRRKKDEEGTKPAGRKLEKYFSNDWTDRALLRLSAPEIWETGSTEKNRERGNLIHHILSGLRYSEDKEMVLQRALGEGLIDDELYQLMDQMLDTIFSDPEIGHFFDKGVQVKNEAGIITSDGTVFRPDRVLIKDHEIEILDYKTGEESLSYHIQIKKYAELLRTMDYTIKGAYLLYLKETPRLVKVL